MDNIQIIRYVQDLPFFRQVFHFVRISSFIVMAVTISRPGLQTECNVEYFLNDINITYVVRQLKRSAALFFDLIK